MSARPVPDTAARDEWLRQGWRSPVGDVATCTACQRQIRVYRRAAKAGGGWRTSQHLDPATDTWCSSDVADSDVRQVHRDRWGNDVTN